MRRSRTQFCLFAVLPLLISAIWLAPATAAVAPAITSLGQIREDLNAPTRIDVDASGNLYVADPRGKKILKFDMYGKAIASFAGVPIFGGIAVDSERSRLYVAGKTQVSVLNSISGELLGHLGKGADEFGYAFDLALDRQGFVFVADAALAQIRVYDPAGEPQYVFGSRGSANGQFGGISALAISPADEVYVADSSYTGTKIPRVQVFDLAGKYLRTLNGSSSFGTKALNDFAGMVFDEAGRGYFLDETNSRVVVLGLPSSFLATYGAVGFGAGKLQAPWDAAFDAVNSRLFVLTGDARIEIFGIDGGSNPIRRNLEPGAPFLLSPIAGSETEEVRPELVFQNASDPDGDSLVYNVRLLRGEQIVVEYATQPQGANPTTVRISQSLEENAAYSWAAQSSDGQAVSAWTSPETFYVNAVQEAPTAPGLLMPVDGETVDGNTVFSWNAAADPDPFDVISYRLEISADQTFAVNVLEEPVDGTAIRLADCAGYPALKDGDKYFWRIRAIDNHGLVSAPGPEGVINYDTTSLKVTANMPEARVYLDGNPAYAGRPVGEAPVELRDLAPGAYTIVVERAGLETFLVQKVLKERENGTVHAVMLPALQPEGSVAVPLSADGKKLAVSGGAAPFLADLDQDDVVDLLVGDAAGGLTFFRGLPTADRVPVFSPGVSLGQFSPGTIPFVADWNNDGRQDLVVGAEDGTISLYLNAGGEIVKAFGTGIHLAVQGVPIQVEKGAAPAVIDFDSDGDKDLIVGARDGSLQLFPNNGTDAEPKLGAPVSLGVIPAPASFFFADWNADGTKEILVAAEEAVYRLIQEENGFFPAVAKDFSPIATVSGKAGGQGGKKTPGQLRLFAFDVDGVNGKDLVFGTADGEVKLARSNGKDYLPAFQGAALDKVAQVEALARAEQPGLLEEVREIRTSVETGDYRKAGQKAKALAKEATAGSALAQVAAEVEELLQ